MTVNEILSSHHFRKTHHRIEVLKLFINSKRSLNHSDIEKQFENKMDRVSIYRILNSFTEARILCKIIDSSGKTSYIFDNHTQHSESQHQPHFKCKTCNDVIDLPELPKQYLDQLQKLNIDSLNLLAEGTCDTCNIKKNGTKSI
jgi:Fur family ferric uptake transcriptional regulator